MAGDGNGNDARTKLIARHLMTAPYDELVRYWLTVSPHEKKDVAATLEGRAIALQIAGHDGRALNHRVAYRIITRIEEMPK